MNIMDRFEGLFKVIDKYESKAAADDNFIDSLGLEKLFSQAASLQNENIDE